MLADVGVVVLVVAAVVAVVVAIVVVVVVVVAMDDSGATAEVAPALELIASDWFWLKLWHCFGDEDDTELFTELVRPIWS